MCGLCGFGLADAELVLGRDVSNRQDTEQPAGQLAMDDSQDVTHPVSQIPTSGGETIVAAPPIAGHSQPDGLFVTLWARIRLALSSHPSPSHSH